MADFHGVFPYLVSPVDASGRIRTEVLGRLCDDLIKAGVHGLTPLGSTGEFAYLNQRRSAQRSCRPPSKPRERPRAGGRRRRLDHRQRTRWRRQGAIKSSAPTAFSRSWRRTFRLADAQVESYFRAIADAVDIPVVIYTNPQFQRSRSHARCHRAARDPSAHRLHQGCLHQPPAGCSRS